MNDYQEMLTQQISEKMVALVHEAVLAEREACALMAEQATSDWLLGKKIAAAIRARGNND